MNNEYSKLKKVIVGVESQFNEKMFDIIFKLFFKENLKDLDFAEIYKEQYSPEIFKKRNEGLDNLANELKKQGIEVYRPDREDIKHIQMPNYKTIIRSSSNVRDTAFIWDKTIYETPQIIKGRVFENTRVYKIFYNLFLNNEFNWVKVPQDFNIDNVDSFHMDNFKEFEKNFNSNKLSNYHMYFDAANLIKCDDYILYNATNYNNYLGYLWLKRNIKSKIYLVSIVDNHIDGCLVPIEKNTFLCNDAKLDKPIEFYLPDEIVNNSKFIKLPKNCKNEMVPDNDYPFLASREGMSINVLSIGERKIVVNKNDDIVAELLFKNNFDVIEVDLPYCRAFGGGIHCSTLDLERI